MTEQPSYLIRFMVMVNVPPPLTTRLGMATNFEERTSAALGGKKRIILF